MLFRLAVVIVNYYSVNQHAWLLCALWFLSSSILILIVQPFKKSYMNVLDALLLALLGFLTLLIATFLYVPQSANGTLPHLMVIACSCPQLVLLLSVTYRQLKGKRIVRCITHKVGALLKQVRTRNQAGDELSDADSLPHRLVSPSKHNRSLLSVSEQANANTETLQYQDN